MAAPPGSRALVPLLLAGDLLAGRYRLEHALPPATPGDPNPAEFWLAHDEVLARRVAAKVLPAGGRRGASTSRLFLEAAAAAGGLAHPGLARVYDAALEPRPAERAGRAAGEIDVAYVISEWVDGPTLAQALAEDGPWEADQAVQLGELLADALAAAHGAGLRHGRVHPGNVLLTAQGSVKLTDLAVSAALPGRAPTVEVDPARSAAADVRDLSAVIYAALTARWPAGATPLPGGGLPEAPAGRETAHRDGAHPHGAHPHGAPRRPAGPRQVRAGVPRALDAVVVRALDPDQAGSAPALTTATGLATALARAVPAEPAGLPVPVRPPRLSPRVRRLLPAVVVLAVLAALGTGAYSVGLNVGSIAPVEDRLAALASPRPDGAATQSGTAISLADATVTAFDPPPGDQRERPGSVANAYDGDASTVWDTERYSSSTFGGIKTGVGLLVDLAEPTALGRVELVLETPGTAVELRVGDTAAADAAGYRVVASGVSAGEGLALVPPAGTQARYVLIWITGLPQVDGMFVAGIADIRLSRP